MSEISIDKIQGGQVYFERVIYYIIYYELFNDMCTALRNQYRKVLEEMSSWTALSWHLRKCIIKEMQHSTTRNS